MRPGAVGAGTSRAVAPDKQALAVHLKRVATRVAAIAMPLIIAVPLKEIVALLTVRAAHPAPGARNRQRAGLRASRVQAPAGLTLGSVQTPAPPVLLIQRPRVSDSRKCYPAPAWLHAARPKTGSAPAASPSTGNQPSSASGCPRQTNYVSTAV
jgi:hypothetical protein